MSNLLPFLYILASKNKKLHYAAQIKYCRLGLVDSRMMKDKSNEFTWVSTICNMCTRLALKFQWGNNLELLKEAASVIESEFRYLQFFSDTR